MDGDVQRLQELVQEFEASCDVAHLDDALALARRLVFGSTAPDGADPALRALLGRLLYTRYDLTEHPFNTALVNVTMHAVVAGACDRVDPRESLGVELPGRPPGGQRAALLSAAIAQLEQVTKQFPRRAADQAVLASAWYDLHADTGEIDALRRAVTKWEAAVYTDPEEPAYLSGLAAALLRLDEYSTGSDNLKRAVGLAIRSVQSPRAAAAPQKPVYLLTLSSVLRALFDSDAYEHMPGGADAYENAQTGALVTAANAADLLDEDHPLRSECGYAMGAALIRDYQATRNHPSLDGAIVCLRDAVDLDPRPEYLRELTSALRYQWFLNTDTATLVAADTVSNRAFGLAHAYDHARHSYLFSHAMSTHLSAIMHGGDNLLDFAVVLTRFAIGSLPPNHPKHAAYAGFLADAWTAKYAATQAAADLSGALAAAEMAASAPDQFEHPECLMRLATVRVSAYFDSKDPQLLDQALHTAFRAEKAVPEQGPRRAALLSQLGTVMTLWAEANDSVQGRQAAHVMFRQSAETDGTPPLIRAQAAMQWTALAAAEQAWASATKGGVTALTALHRMTGFEVSQNSQETRLAQYSGLPAEVAGYALNIGSAELALEILELGRGVILGQSMDLRGDLRLLARDAPELAAEIAQHIQERDAGAADLHAMAVAGSFLEHAGAEAAERHRRASFKIQALVSLARQVPGHQAFLSAPTAEELLSPSASGPIVVINVSEFRSDALIIQPGGVSVVPLPALTPSAVAAVADTIHTAVDPAAGRCEADDALSQQQFLGALEWLWDNLAGPVLDVAAPRHQQTGGELPRVWWCPTGILGTVPIHAAGYHRSHEQRAYKTVIGRVISSYTPTIRALRRARANHSPSSSAGTLLVVAIPESPRGLPDLPGSRAEADLLAKTHPGTSVLIGAAANRAAVSAALPLHSRVHFACHSWPDPDHPSLGLLVLHDDSDILTVGDLSRLDLSHAELAYLSVCSAAQPGRGMPDEAIHFAGVLLMAGYPSVIGALWNVRDALARRIAGRFYSGLARDQTSRPGVARTLHHVLRAIYDEDPVNPRRWASLVHLGD